MAQPQSPSFPLLATLLANRHDCCVVYVQALDEVMAEIAIMANDAGKREQAEGFPGQPHSAPRAERPPAPSITVSKAHGHPIPPEKKPKPAERTRGPSRLARGTGPEDAAPTLGPIPGPSNVGNPPPPHTHTHLSTNFNLTKHTGS